MKIRNRFLSVIALAVSLTVLMMAFVGCLGNDNDPSGGNQQNEDLVGEKNATELLAAAFVKSADTTKSFVEGKLGQIKLPSLDNGMTLTMNLDEANFDGANFVNADFELAVKDDLASLALMAEVGGEQIISLSAATDKATAVFSSAEIFGDGKYGFSLENFAENFKESSLFDRLNAEDMLDGSLEEIVDTIVENIEKLNNIEVDDNGELEADINGIFESFKNELSKVVKSKVEKSVECESMNGKIPAAYAEITLTGNALSTAIKNTFDTIENKASLLNTIDGIFGGMGVFSGFFNYGEYTTDESISAIEGLEEGLVEFAETIDDIKIAAFVSEKDLSLLTISVELKVSGVTVLTVEADLSKVTAESFEGFVSFAADDGVGLKIEIVNSGITVTSTEYTYYYGDDYVEFDDYGEFDDYSDDMDYSDEYGDISFEEVLQTTVVTALVTNDTAEALELSITTTVDDVKTSDVTVKYDRANGDYEIVVKDEYSTEMTVNGSLTFDENKVEFKLDSIAMSFEDFETETDYNLTVSIVAGAEIDALPDEYTDLLTLDTAGVQTFIGKVVQNVSDMFEQFIPSQDDLYGEDMYF